MDPSRLGIEWVTCFTSTKSNLFNILLCERSKVSRKEKKIALLWCSVFDMFLHNWKQWGPVTKWIFSRGINRTFKFSCSSYHAKSTWPLLSKNSHQPVSELRREVTFSCFFIGFLFIFLNRHFANQSCVMWAGQQNVCFHTKMWGSENECKVKCASIVGLSWRPSVGGTSRARLCLQQVHRQQH